MAELIIAEKPSAAKKIAEALADGKAIKESVKGVSYYLVTHEKQDILVAAAVGHLYGLAEIKKKGVRYPVFDVEWRPIYEVDRDAKFSKKYVEALKALCRKADSFVVACDYDVEGSTIGWNIIRFICNRKDAKRMKFSTLTRDELRQSYSTASPHLDWGQAYAGATRHELDWYYGINVSRAMTAAIKKAGLFKILSSGRVQGPALKIVVDREKGIHAFTPVPFWQVELAGQVQTGSITAWHEADKFWKKEEAESVLEKCRGKDGAVAEVKRDEFRQPPPVPFDLTTLQTEAYRCFGINPKYTLDIAQDLYTAGCISYPRTSSQQLPPSLGFRAILQQLEKQKDYISLCGELLQKQELMPNNGKKTDPAHPAIFPTGVVPKLLEERKRKVYDLVVKRFLAAFADAAVRETIAARIVVAAEGFVAKGTRTKEKGWHRYYEPYVKLKEEELPKVKQGETVSRVKLTMHDRETQPPKRYTEASLVRELEKRNLGTKATRAQVVDTLMQRGYINGKALEATDLGMHTIEVLEKHAPDIVNEELTRHFEMEMEEIREKGKEGKDVLEEAKTVLIKIMDGFRKHEKEIGDGLVTATKESEQKANTVGQCPKCGGTLMIKRGKFGRFIACGRYPECSESFKLPATGLAKVTDKLCEHCAHPVILMIRKARKPMDACINPDCPSKRIKTDKENVVCPKCKEGKMVIRKSVYGQFLGCNNFPKCRNIMRA